MNSDGLMPRMAACCSTSTRSAMVIRGFGPFTRRSSGAFLGRPMHRPAASFLRSKNTSGYTDQGTARLVKASIMPGNLSGCRGAPDQFPLNGNPTCSTLPDGRGRARSLLRVYKCALRAFRPFRRSETGPHANPVCILRLMVSAGQSMQESPEASRCWSLRLRCGFRFAALVGQQGGQFPPFLGLRVQPVP
jgi:hypothetical protein